MRETESLRRTLGRGELVRLLYRLGRQGASGVLTLTMRVSRGEVFVLRRGHAITTDELAKKTLVSRFTRLCAEPTVHASFESGVTACPPGAQHQVALASWARTHLEQQLDGNLAPEAVDEADRRMLIAMAMPRRLDQIWPLARTPRFRLLAFIHFLRAVDAIDCAGIAAEPLVAPRLDGQRQAAARLLGVADTDDVDAVKRAYRRLARTLHPDLQPGIDGDRKRLLERRFAEVTAAYEALI